ncbi:hypothetical protein GGR88_000136 [Sphingomonas jejuensis]|uniref:Uncharacterized protein n=1 Tax=Sphingomonas jejuensis TaxID=904715 RepID=A0ABX0XIH6_9SPHN|nr:hypothetical protein [Sphingomonas jejuensis]NJC32662.1 hypothetical protein [Sphingomonas jejuensis]
MTLNEQVNRRPIYMWRLAGWSIGGVLLLLPAVAMQFTAEVRWTASDFVFAAALIGFVGGGFELAVRLDRSPAYRAGAALMLLTIFFLIWVNGAVGIIGDEDNPLNLLYAAVIATCIGGASIARLRPAGMARAAAAAAGVQMMVGVVAVVAGADQPPGAIGLAVLNGGVAALLAASAFLFARSARRPVG